MKYVFFLSGDYIELAKEEIQSLFDSKKSILDGQVLILDINEAEKEVLEKAGRLALSKKAYRVLFECNENEIMEFIKAFNWDSAYSKSFCLRIFGSKKYGEKKFAGLIWDRLKNPKVSLDNPKTLFEIFFIKGRAYSSVLIHENKEDFEKRKPHKRPFPHPGSMHPKIAKALINIAGAQKNDTILDPFCGTGGFLIEAGLMGIKSQGYDISKNMVEGCRKNLRHFKIKNSKISVKNALNIKKKFDVIISDLPYGLNSNLYLKLRKRTLRYKGNKINIKTQKESQIKNIEKFYLEFLKGIKGKCKSAVIIFPSFVNYKKLIKAAGFVLERVDSIYVHRSLTRKIAKIR